MNDETSIETPIVADLSNLTPEEFKAKYGAGEASPEEAEVFITEDTADHSVTIH